MGGVVEEQLGFAGLGAPRINYYDLLYAPLRMPDVVVWIDVHLPTTHMYLRSRISNELDIPTAVELSAMTKTWSMWASPLRNVQKSYSLSLVITSNLARTAAVAPVETRAVDSAPVTTRDEFYT